MRPLLSATLALAALLGLPAAAAAQDVTTSGDDYVLQFDEENGEKLIDFIDLAKVILGRPIKYDRAQVSDIRIQIVGPIKVRRDDFYLFFQAVLRAYDFIVSDYGPEGSRFLSVQRITAGGAAGRPGQGGKVHAPIVPMELLELYAQNPAVLITTSIPLKYVDARNAMSTFTPFFDTQIEQVRAVENSNSLVLTGFGTNVWGAFQLVGLVDVPPFSPQPMIRRRVLEHASVDEVEQVLTDLLAASRGLRPGQTQVQQAAGNTSFREIEPRIIPDPRSNAFLLAGEPDIVDRLESWIDILDVEVEPRGFTHVVRLQNTDAAAVEEVLTSVLQNEESNQQAARTGQGGAAPGGGGLEIPASVVADTTSNSLIITASDRKYAELLETLDALDIRRPQVLVEAAIVETSRTLNEVFAAGVGAANADDGAFVSNFGTPIGSFDDDGNLDIADTFSNVGPGGTIAVFSGQDIPIPVFLQWLEGNTETRVLSRPSLLTNDNQEAELAAETETAYQVTTTGQNSVTTNAFETVTAGIRLGVSPTISAGNYLRLQVRIEVSDFQPSQSGIVGAPPDIISRTIETPVTVPDGHTVILGGLVSRNARSTDSKVPWIGDLPLIGWIFRSFNDTSEDRYLYVFITSHIIDTDFALLDEISAARRADVNRLGGDLSELVSSLSTEDMPDEMPVLSGLDEVFEMPTVAVPPVGERDAVPTGPQGDF